jgi:hypothetical protein
MTPEHAIGSMLTEMRNNSLFPKIHENQVRRYLYMSYGIGYNSGAANTSGTIPVIRMDKLGLNHVYYESMAIAARKNNTTRQEISAVCRGINHSCKGYIWKYAVNQPLKPIQIHEDKTDPDS